MSAERSDRPIWLGTDGRGWDHARIHRQVLEDPALGAYELAVYLGLAIHAEARSGSARPAAATLARYANMGERRARTALTTLAEAGWISVTERPGKASTYRLLPPPTPAREAGVTPARGAAHPGTRSRAPRHEEPRTPARGADELEPGTRTRDETQEQPPAADAPGALFHVKPDPTPGPNERLAAFEFEDWYRVYPLRRDRGHAERAYRKARREASAEELLAGARRYADEQTRALAPGEFRPHTAQPATWLNGKRWLDEPATPKAGPRRGTGSEWDRTAKSGAVDPGEL